MQKYDMWKYWSSNMKEMDIYILKSPTVTQLLQFFFFFTDTKFAYRRGKMFGG